MEHTTLLNMADWQTTTRELAQFRLIIFPPKFMCIKVYIPEVSIRPPSYNNNNNFLCANILENQAQWRDKTKGLSNCVNVEQCVSR